MPKPTNALFKFFKWNLEKKWKATKTQKKNLKNWLSQRNLSNAICKQQIATDHRTTCTTARQSKHDASTPLRFANTQLQNFKELLYLRNHNAEQHWRGHSSAICRLQRPKNCMRNHNAEQHWRRHPIGICKHHSIMFANTKFFLSKTCSKTRSQRQNQKNSNLEDLEDYEKPKKT